MLQVERHHHKGNDAIVALCKTSKELYNKCTFLMRQAWFGDAKLPNINDLVTAVKDEDCFKDISGSWVIQNALLGLRKWVMFWPSSELRLRNLRQVILAKLFSKTNIKLSFYINDAPNTD